MGTPIYSDLHFKLKKDLSGSVTIEKDIDSVKQSIKMILSTFPGERLMEIEFGSKLRALLFEPMDKITEKLIELEIERSVLTWEDRVTIGKVEVTPNEDGNYYEVNVDFNIIEINKNATFSGRINVPDL